MSEVYPKLEESQEGNYINIDKVDAEPAQGTQFQQSTAFENRRIDVEEDHPPIMAEDETQNNQVMGQDLNQFMVEEDSKLADYTNKDLNDYTRMGFVRKVLGIVAAMLTTTALFIIAPMYVPSIDIYLRSEESLWLDIVSLVVSLICIYALGCYQSVARSVPINYILLFVFTCAQSWSVTCVTVLYTPESVFIAAIITAAMTCGLALYAITAKIDFRPLISMIFALSSILFSCMILSFFYMPRWMEILIAACAVFCLSIYIIIDIVLITGRNSHKFSIDDYIMAAMHLYIDLIRMFLYLLEIFGSSN